MAKCRLEVWNPILNNQEVGRWVKAQTPTNKNALLTWSIEDKLANTRKAHVVLVNRPYDFSSSGTFSYDYKQSDDTDVFNSPLNLPKKYGVLTNFFREYAQCRIIEESTNLILYAGKIHNVDMATGKGSGANVKLELRDALFDLQEREPSPEFDLVKFYTHGSTAEDKPDSMSVGHKLNDMVNSVLNLSQGFDYFISNKQISIRSVANSILGKITNSAGNDESNAI